MENMKYPHLFSPIKINKTMVKNRLMSAPIEFYWERSNDGYGIMVRGTGGCVIGPRSRGSASPGPLETPMGILKYKDEITEMKQRGAKASVELCWGGSKAWAPAGDFVYGPDEGVKPNGARIKAMDEKDMEDVCKQWATSAKLMKEIGFDMIMIHFAHGWGPSEFLSPLTNHRTDEFGGSIENRCRFPKMVVEAIRKAVGPDYPLDMRISAEEPEENGLKIDDVIYFIKEVEGLIDMVNLSYGSAIGSTQTISPMYYPHMVNVKYSEMAKKAGIKIPVGIVGAIFSPEEAEEIIASGKADMIVLGRAGCADPQWVTKAREGRSEDIVPCIRCMECREPSCSVNPKLYIGERQDTDWFKPAEVKKNIVIIGGGVAGMNAAIVASKRGHHVTLFEKSDRLGGVINCSDYETIKPDLRIYRDYIVHQTLKNNIDIRMNTKATPEMVKAMNPDAIILAMGADPVTPKFKGVDHPKVMQAIDVYPVMDKIGENVVILGAGLVGGELAVELADKGKKVTLTAARDRICDTGIYHPFPESLKGRLDSHSNQVTAKFRLTPTDAQGKVENNLREIMATRDITQLTSVKVIEVNDEGVVIERNNEFTTLKADTVILAKGFRPKYEEAEGFYGICQDTITIGDLDQVANIGRAVNRAYIVAAAL